MEEIIEPKKYLSCDLIEHGFDFNVQSINFCCRTPESGSGFKPLIPGYYGEKIDWDELFSIKNAYRKQMKIEVIPECKGCVHLYEKEWDNENYISHINFNHWITCNARCVYCCLDDYVKSNKGEKHYNVYPVIKDMVDKKILRTDGNITIAGGEPTIVGEFEKLLNLLLDYGVKDIRLNTNAIKYSKAVERGIKLGVITLVTSVDSGTKETFKQIKKVDAHNKVWDNVKKYCKVQIKDYQVKTKFIIIPGVNDNQKEIDNWIQKSTDAGLKQIAVDVELNWYGENKDNLPDKLFETFKYIIDKATEKNLQIEYQDRAMMLLKKMNRTNQA